MSAAGEQERPPNGYSLDLYDRLKTAVDRIPVLIERYRVEIAQREQIIAEWEDELDDARKTLAWMREHQADEIAEVEARRERVRVRLRTAGWKV